MNNVVIIGGTNVDYLGISNSELIKSDSNIGKITISFGGVAHNICENLGRLNIASTFITSIANDTLGNLIKKELLDLNISLITPSNVPSNGGYLAIHNNSGDMELALCDQDAITYISKDFILKNINYINQAKYLIIDTNFSQDIIDFIFENFSNKIIFVDAISCTKALKIKKHLNKISYLKCNMNEALYLFDDINLFPNSLLITNKDKEILFKSQSFSYKTNPIQILSSDVVNTTGAGDAFFSGFIYGVINDKSIQESIEYGKILANITMKCNSATSKAINIEIFKCI